MDGLAAMPTTVPPTASPTFFFSCVAKAQAHSRLIRVVVVDVVVVVIHKITSMPLIFRYIHIGTNRM